MKKIDFRKKDPNYSREGKKYDRPVPSRVFVMDYLGEVGRPATQKHLIQAFGLKHEVDVESFVRRLRAMERDGQLIRNRRGSYALVDKLSLVRGTVLGHKDGFGFLIPDEEGNDIFLPASQMRQLMHGDRVLVSVGPKDTRGRHEGTLVEVLESRTERVVGRFFQEGSASFVVPSNTRISQDVIIPTDKRHGARHGQIVVAKILAQPKRRRQPMGEITEVLGDHMAPGMEIEVAIRSHNLPHEWPDAVLDEVDRFSSKVEKKDLQGRKDLRSLPLVTIDGEDAKDFDDAVYCERLPKGGWRLYVAIADVSHYVQPGSALDAEAEVRGNSAYFPGYVIPMLPEFLSNGLCSLNPAVDRLCMVCEMTISDEGKIRQHQFYDAVMRSHARLTYNLVAQMLKGKSKQHYALLPHIKELEALYKVLVKQRSRRGAIEFETIETRIVFGENRKIDKIVPVQRNDAHRIIEECMLAANVSSAKYLLQHKMPALFRVHKAPDPEKIDNLRDFLSGFGLRLTGGDKPRPQDYSKLLASIKGRPDANLIQTVMLRSLQQAVYAPENVGHFGLAYEAYGHFTSPIRRYPDLLVHRAIRHLNAHRAVDDFTYDAQKMAKYGDHCSTTERRADEATRDAMDWLKCEYMLDKVGEEFDGVITGVTGFGVFVELKSIFVEGLVHITALKNDYYDFDPTKHSLVGKHHGGIYRLGDPVHIRVARVNLDDRKIDFELSENK